MLFLAHSDGDAADLKQAHGPLAGPIQTTYDVHSDCNSCWLFVIECRNSSISADNGLLSPACWPDGLVYCLALALSKICHLGAWRFKFRAYVLLTKLSSRFRIRPVAWEGAQGHDVGCYAAFCAPLQQRQML